MEKIVFLFFFVVNCSNADAQGIISDQQVEAGLKTFFTRLQFDNRSSQNPAITQLDLDKLEKKYCSYTILSKSRNGSDPLFKIVADIDLTTMKIKQDNKKPNWFLLSYISEYEQRTPRTIHINVLKQGSDFKIVSVW